MSIRQAAVAAAQRGWAVFPCRPGDKRPAVPDHPEDECQQHGYCRDGHLGWEQLAVSNPETVIRHWPSDRHNPGIACGPSRLVVLDLDAHGELPPEWRELPGVNDGRDVLSQICEWAGMDWPHTYTVATPSGGWHLYFAAPERSAIRNSASLIGPQVDVRAAGGYVVGAGSIVNGRAYEVLYDDEPAPLPPWIARLLEPRSDGPGTAGNFARCGQPGKRLEGLLRIVAEGKPHDRTGPLVWAAFRLRDMIAAGHAAESDGELLVQAAVSAGISGGERYARNQVKSVLGRAS